MLKTLSIRTGSKTELADITSRVQEAVGQSEVSDGLCHLFVAHTTAGITINENADPSVQSDILMVLNKIISDREPYQHTEGNSPAHIKASLTGCHLTVIVKGGTLLLGTWQGIYLCEFDGPRNRKVHVKVVAD